MPKYCIIVRNVSDTTSRPPYVIGAEQVEYCTAANPEIVDQLVRKEISRTTDPSLYSWTITEQPE